MTDTRKRCWEGAQDADEMSMTCMLERDHRGDHEWTRDDGIVIGFAKSLVGESEYDREP